MLYLVSNKYFRKKVEKLVAPRQYFIIDGENSAVTESRLESIADKYNNTHTLSAWTPESYVYKKLKQLHNGEEINKEKFAKAVKAYLKDESFVAAALQTIKAQATYGIEDDMNIFVVLPDKVYKHLRKKIRNHLIKMMDGEESWIRTQDDIEENGKKILKDAVKPKVLKSLLKSCKKIEKKYKFKSDDD